MLSKQPITPQVMPSPLASKPVQAYQTQPVNPEEQASAEQGIYVDISSLAHDKLNASQNKHQDIDDSDLPEHIKDLLKRIRETKERLTEKQQELIQINSAMNLSAEEKELLSHKVQREVAALASELTQLMGLLRKALLESNLSPDQQKNAALLLMK